MPSFANIIQLSKVRLTSSVVFSAIAGYFIAADQFDVLTFTYLVIGGFLVVAASNGFNQILEKEYDKLMARTADRPLPTERMSISEAFWISLMMGLLGVFLLYRINFLSGFFGTLSIILYVLVYTPLKRISPISVFVGAFPGAIPFMLGWIAASTNGFNIEPVLLFAVQFIWQFPHFWAIAWVCDDDYKKAGFKMLPTGKKDKSTAFQIVFYTIWTILVSLIPMSGYSGAFTISYISGLLIFLAGLFMLSRSINLMSYMNNLHAARLKYASIFYLTFIQIIFVLDKFIM